MLHNRYYFAARAAEERRKAMASSELNARAIHLELARRYDMLVDAMPHSGAEASDDEECGSEVQLGPV